MLVDFYVISDACVLGVYSYLWLISLMLLSLIGWKMAQPLSPRPRGCAAGILYLMFSFFLRISLTTHQLS